jgi:hypothetical protein
MTRKPPESTHPRRFRRTRAAAVLTALALSAPVGLVAATTGTAGAAPADGVPLTFTGDALGRNLVAPAAAANWTWESDDFDQLRTLVDNYSSGGVTFDLGAAVASPTYNRGNPAVTGDETGTLANVDVYFSSAVGGGVDGPDGGTTVDYGETGYSAEEEQALLAWVQDGGVLIANTNSRAFDNTRYLGDNPDQGDFVRVAEPVAYFDGVLSHGCLDQPGPVDCQGGQTESAPAASPVNASAPAELVAGVGAIRNWHTITYFEDGTLPNNAQTLATLSYTCPTPTAAYCTNGSAGPPVVEATFNNNIGSNRTVAAYMDFGSDQFGDGAVVFTSDVDTFSNHYDTGVGGGGGEMAPGNLALAENVLDWIAANRAVALPSDPGFTAITPTRAYDTRNNIGNAGTNDVAGGEFRDVQITGTLPNSSVTIPADATAVALNVTATNQTGAGFLTVTPGGAAKSNTSNLNIPPGLIDVANATVVGLGSAGKVRVYNENNPTDIIVDVVGYWAPGSGEFLTATNPADGRVFDTRNSTKLAQGESRKVQITGGVVPGGATGVVMNVTATNGDRGGFLTVHDTPTVPNASNVNFRANTNVPNLVFAKLAGDGSVYVTNAIGSTDVIFDVAGYFSTSGSGINAVGPGRIFDTRQPIGQLFAGKVASNGSATVGINGAQGLLPTDNVGSVLVNLTVNEPAAAGFLTAYPNAGGVPNASNVNFAPGQTVANLALAQVGADGNLRVANTSPGASHVIIDVFAWFD